MVGLVTTILSGSSPIFRRQMSVSFREVFFSPPPKKKHRWEVLTLSASVLFYIPMVRELALWTRCIDARKSVATKALKKKRSFLARFGKKKRWVWGLVVCSTTICFICFFLGGRLGSCSFHVFFALERISFHLHVWLQGKIYGVGIQSPNLRMVSWKLNEVIGHPDHLTRWDP